MGRIPESSRAMSSHPKGQPEWIGPDQLGLAIFVILSCRRRESALEFLNV